MFKKIKNFLNSKVVSAVFAAFFFFFTGWCCAIEVMRIKYAIPAPANILLGIASFIWGIIKLYHLVKK